MRQEYSTVHQPIGTSTRPTRQVYPPAQEGTDYVVTFRDNTTHRYNGVAAVSVEHGLVSLFRGGLLAAYSADQIRAIEKVG